MMLEVFHALAPAWKRRASGSHDVNFMLELGQQPQLLLVGTAQLERFPEKRSDHLGEIQCRRTITGWIRIGVRRGDGNGRHDSILVEGNRYETWTLRGRAAKLDR